MNMLLPYRIANVHLALALTLTLSGCSTMRSYDGELKQTVDLVAQGRIDQALQQQEANNTSSDKDLLYFLEKGELLRLKNQYNDSIATWLSADKLVNEWENEAKIRGSAILENIGSVLLNDKTRRYDGHDYEKVMLSTQLALNHLLNGKWDLARTEIKKTHEREAIIAQYRTQETDAVEKASRQKGVSTTFKDLNGYPVATLDSLDVSELKNGYQSAFSHYLAGFVYEALNEPSLAAPGYRQAIELRPNIKLLEEGLAGLDHRNHDLNANTTDVLLVVESGAAPALSSITIPIPVFYNNLGVIPISFPILHSEPIRTALPSSVSIDGVMTQNLVGITSLDAMAKRALRDDIPGIVLRGVLRAAVKTASQKALMSSDNGYVKLAGIALNVMNVITESADERSWRTLPSLISIARFTLPEGKHTFSVMNSNGTVSSESVNINGSHALVTVRTLGDQTYWSQPIYSGQMPARVALPPQKVETLDSNESTPINKKESSNKRTQRNKLKKKVKK
ncbi:MAG: hypothetical protein RL755_141 [Pseudomonadota bacterium]